jgi:hypothetical protein
MVAVRDPDSSIQWPALLWERDLFHHQVCSNLLTRGVLMLCDTGCPHVAHILQDILCFMHWNVLDYLPYSLDLTPCDLCILLPSRKCWIHRVELNKDIKAMVVQQFRDFFAVGIQQPMWWWSVSQQPWELYTVSSAWLKQVSCERASN